MQPTVGRTYLSTLDQWVKIHRVQVKDQLAFGVVVKGILKDRERAILFEHVVREITPAEQAMSPRKRRKKR